MDSDKLYCAVSDCKTMTVTMVPLTPEETDARLAEVAQTETDAADVDKLSARFITLKTKINARTATLEDLLEYISLKG